MWRLLSSSSSVLNRGEGEGEGEGDRSPLSVLILVALELDEDMTARWMTGGLGSDDASSGSQLREAPRMDESHELTRIAAPDPTFSSSSTTEVKQSHQWLTDTVRSESFSDKKQDTHPPSTRLISGILPSSAAPWEGVTGFRSIQIQGLDKLFGPENIYPMNFDGRKGDHFLDSDDIAVGLSISQCGENPEACLSFSGIKRLKVDQARDSGGGICMQRMSTLDGDNSSNLPVGVANIQANETAFASLGPTWDKNVADASFFMRDYEEQIHIGTADSAYDNEAVNVVSVANPYKGEVGVLPFSGYNRKEGSTIPVGTPLCSLDESYVQLSQIKQINGKNSLDPVSNATRVIKPRSNSGSKNKPESKHLKKESPNHFPSNVRNLICTGILDGVPVKYVSSSREQLRGVIKGSGYLCGCLLCDFSKVLSPFEFEKHAGCKTKHPNNHIFFENGKTIYQIVQELRSTPEDMLFDAVQSIFGTPINQKSFLIWKESYLAATRELQRIYGKEMNA